MKFIYSKTFITPKVFGFAMAQLIVTEARQGVDFSQIIDSWKQPVRRLFWIYDVPSYGLRGRHRHQEECQMILHCAVGKVKVYVQTPEVECTYLLDSNNKYLVLEGNEWRMMHQFSADALLMIMANQSFETTRYIDEPYRPFDLSLDML